MTVQEPIEWKMIVQRIIYGKVELDSGNVYLYLVLGESPYCMYFVNIIFHSTEWHKPKLLTITCVLIWHHLLRWYTLTLLADIAMLFMKTHNIPRFMYPNLNLFDPYPFKISVRILFFLDNFLQEELFIQPLPSLSATFTGIFLEPLHF